MQSAQPTAPAQRLSPTQFLELFKTIEADSFFIESTGDAADMTNFRFKGVELDSSNYKFFSDTVLIEWVQRGGGQLFACYRFPLTPTVYGLILRTPSDYWESSIRIFLFDIQSGKTIQDLEVGEEWGDAGDSLSKCALLIRQNGKWKVLIFQNLCHPLDETLDNIECVDSTFSYSILPAGFREQSRIQSDTAKENPVNRRFSGR